MKTLRVRDGERKWRWWKQFAVTTAPENDVRNGVVQENSQWLPKTLAYPRIPIAAVVNCSIPLSPFQSLT